MRFVVAVAASLLLFAAACGKDSSGPSGGVTLNNGTFAGTIDGATYAPLVVNITQTASASATIVAMGAADGQGRGLGWAFFVNGPGTYGINQTAGNNATFVDGTSSWYGGSGINGSSGSLTITSISATRVVGSFSLTLIAQPGTTATGTRTINASFDITPIT
jgi:hypothetical protein